MATRTKKSPPPVTWLRRLRQRLTSRMACFVWGAIFGNAILSQPIQPLNLILEPPENMLSAASRQWLDALRAGIRSLSTTFTGTAVQVLREQATELIPAAAPPATPLPPPPKANSRPVPTSSPRRGRPATSLRHQHAMGTAGPVLRCFCRAVFGAYQDPHGGGRKAQPFAPAPGSWHCAQRPASTPTAAFPRHGVPL